MFKYASFILFLESLGYKNVFINKPMRSSTWDNPHLAVFDYTGTSPTLPKQITITLYSNSTGMLTPILITWTKMCECAEVDVFNYRSYTDARERLTILSERG